MRRALFVLGMHRSGTSAVAGALSHVGFTHTAALMPPQPDNPDGFFEPLPVVRLNNLILSLAGGSWDRVPLPVDAATLQPRPLADLAAAQYGPAAAEAWATAFGDVEGDVVCKDPRLCLTYPLWRAAAEAAGFSPDVLVVLRGVEAIAASLARRDGFAFARAADLVADYWTAMLQAAPPDARILDFDRFRAAPADTFAALGFPVSDAARAALAAAVRPKTSATQVLAPPPLTPASVRQLGAALQAAHGKRLADAALPDLKPHLRERSTVKLAQGATYLVADEPPLATQPRRVRNRKVLLHLHIFKNAGSSVDVILKENFGPRWLLKEFPFRADHANADVINTFLRRNPGIDVLASHTADWWLGHGNDELTVVPILFLREPFLRIRSAYSFEVKQTADTVGARLAKAHDFPGYVAARLARPNDYAFRNFQARRLAALETRVPVDLEGAAFRALGRAPFVGLVEDFDRSMARLETVVRPHFPSFRAFSVRANATAKGEGGPVDVAAGVARVRAELGEALADELAAANAVDLALYAAATERFAPAPEPAAAPDAVAEP